jgi:hypothetical protein
MSVNESECGRQVLLAMSCSINAGNFGSQLKMIASKRTRERERGERERKKQITNSNQCKHMTICFMRFGSKEPTPR